MRIDTVYDIGAYKGNWTKEISTYALSNSKFILFEANPAYKEDLEKAGHNYLIAVLSNPGREYVDFYNGTNTGDSYYKENSIFYENQTSIRLPCYTLNHVVDTLRLPIPNLIKLDTQGSELDILKGAEDFIDQVDLIYTECPIVCYNSNAPSIQEYLEYFKQKRFVPVDLFETHRFEETLLQVDIMFMREDVKNQFLSPNDCYSPWKT